MKNTLVWITTLLALGLLALHGAEPNGHEADRISESRVTLRGEIRLAEALSKLTATGNPVIDLRPRLGQEVSDPLLRLDLSDAPFWQAADAIAAQAQLRLTPHMDRGSGLPALGIQALSTEGIPSLIPTAYVGPFRIRLKRMTATRDLAEPLADKLVCVLELAAEPRLEPILLRHEKDCIGYGFSNKRGQASLSAGTGVISWLGQAALEIPVSLPLPPRADSVLTELKGSFKVLIPPGKVTFRLDGPKAGLEENRDGISLQILGVTFSPSGTQCRVQLRLRYPEGSLALESHQTWAFERNRLELRHRQTGTVLRPAGTEIGIDEGREVRISYTFRDLPESRLVEYELLYQTFSPPTLYPLEFSLRDLPLP